MKIKFTMLMYSAVAMMLLSAVNSRAQDATKAAPNAYKLLKDTMGMRALKVEIKPGESVPMHSHPPHMAYVLEGGTIEMTDKGHPPVTVEMKAGEVMALPATTHSAKNVGKTTLKAIIFEKKGGPMPPRPMQPMPPHPEK